MPGGAARQSGACGSVTRRDPADPADARYGAARLREGFS
jgi:hypothetical protein